MNSFKTYGLMLALLLLFVWIGNLIAGQAGMMWAFFLACAMNFVSYWFSDKIVLSLYKARELSQNEAGGLYPLVANISQAAAMPMPKIYMIESMSPNAFATGRDPAHSAVAVTRGIVDLLDNRELSGVIAHELSHIKNRDTLISMLAATIAGAVFMLSRMASWAMMFGGRNDGENRGNGIVMLVVMILAPVAASIIQLAISRAREYGADESAARISGDPLALAGALRKLTDASKRIPFAANPVTAHFFIVNPLKADKVLSFFSTHPPIEERIKRLENLAGMKL